ncbi:MAG: hypothetical protein QM492_11055 [Rhodobacterales bacterium]
MTFKKIRTGLGLAALALGLMGSSAAQAGFSTTNVQLLYGDGFRLGGNGLGKTARETVTINHFDTWKYGENFFFVDIFHDDTVVGTNNTTDTYGELWSHLSFSKISGKDLNFGFVKDVLVGASINQGNNFTVGLLGLRADLDIPGFNFVTFGVYSYNNVTDPFGRNLHTTTQETIVWDADIPASGRWKFKFKGFVDFIGAQGSGVDNQIVFQPELLLDVGNFWGKPGKVGLGLEYAYFKNKFGVTGVNDNVLQLLLEFTLH